MYNPTEINIFPDLDSESRQGEDDARGRGVTACGPWTCARTRAVCTYWLYVHRRRPRGLGGPARSGAVGGRGRVRVVRVAVRATSHRWPATPRSSTPLARTRGGGAVRGPGRVAIGVVGCRPLGVMSWGERGRWKRKMLLIIVILAVRRN